MKHINTRSFILFIFFLFGVSFLLTAWTTGTKVDGWASTFSVGYKALGCTAILWAGFAHFAWKWRCFQGWLVVFPNLNGTWHGTIQTTWHDAEGQEPGPIPAMLTIQQKFGVVSCVLRTQESSSFSYLADFWLEPDQQIRRLACSYTNTPNPTVGVRSQRHDGTMLVELIMGPDKELLGFIPSKKVTKLNGSYWTTRRTTGSVEFEFRSHQLEQEMPSDLGSHPMAGR